MYAQPLVIAEKLPMGASCRKNLYEPFKRLLKNKYGPSKEPKP